MRQVIYKITLMCMFIVSALAIAKMAEAAPLVLARDGSAEAIIVTPLSPSDVEKFAAERLADFLGKMTGGKFEIVTERTGVNLEQPVISIGRTSLAKELEMKGPSWKKNSREAFRMLRRNNALIICGNQSSGTSELGTLWGVYCFLEMQGVGQYLPDPLGQVIPDKPTLTVDDLDITDAPALKMRGACETPAGYLRRYGPSGDLAGQDTSWLMFSRQATQDRCEYMHMYQYAITPEVRKAHPEWFEGTHNPRHGSQPSASVEAGICLTNPEVRKHFADYFREMFRANPDLKQASICPDDYSLGDRCDCAECQRLMGLSAPPTWTDDSHRCSSDLHIDFVNAVLKDLEKDYPDRKLVTYAYLDYIDPPTKTRVHPNVVVMIAPLRGPDELHPALDDIVRGWRRMGAQELYWYAYILARPPIPHLMGAWYRNYSRLGIDGVYLEFCHNIGAFSALNAWLQTKLMWDPETDVGKLIDQYCDGLFGREIGPLMARFFTGWDLKTPFAEDDLPLLLAAAEKKAGDPASMMGRRVRLFKLAYDLWRSSYDLDEALKLNDLPRACRIVKSGLEASDSLRKDYPGWALNQNVSMFNRVGWCEYSASVLPTLESLAKSPLVKPALEVPTPGHALCLTNNEDIPQTERLNAGVTVPSLSDEEGRKLFDGRIEGNDHTVRAGSSATWTVDLDLGKDYQIDHLDICMSMTIGAGSLIRSASVPIYVDVQVSNDGRDFRSVDRIMPRTLRGWHQSGSILTTARYVRLVTGSLNWWHEFSEVRVWGRPVLH